MHDKFCTLDKYEEERVRMDVFIKACDMQNFPIADYITQLFVSEEHAINVNGVIHQTIDFKEMVEIMGIFRRKDEES